MIKVTSKIRMNFPKLQHLTQAQVTALEQTAEALHTEVVQAQVVPRKDGALQEESFFVDDSRSAEGKVSLIHAEPYARRLYFHPEYHFHKGPWEEEWTDKEGIKHHVKHDGNPNAKGKWYADWLPGGSQADFAAKAFKNIYRRLTGI